jgi:hypothetical protein
MNPVTKLHIGVRIALKGANNLNSPELRSPKSSKLDLAVAADDLFVQIENEHGRSIAGGGR